MPIWCVASHLAEGGGQVGLTSPAVKQHALRGSPADIGAPAIGFCDLRFGFWFSAAVGRARAAWSALESG